MNLSTLGTIPRYQARNEHDSGLEVTRLVGHILCLAMSIDCQRVGRVLLDLQREANVAPEVVVAEWECFDKKT